MRANIQWKITSLSNGAVSSVHFRHAKADKKGGRLGVKGRLPSVKSVNLGLPVEGLDPPLTRKTHAIHFFFCGATCRNTLCFFDDGHDIHGQQ